MKDPIPEICNLNPISEFPLPTLSKEITIQTKAQRMSSRDTFHSQVLVEGKEIPNKQRFLMQIVVNKGNMQISGHFGC